MKIKFCSLKTSEHTFPNNFPLKKLICNKSVIEEEIIDIIYFWYQRGTYRVGKLKEEIREGERGEISVRVAGRERGRVRQRAGGEGFKIIVKQWLSRSHWKSKREREGSAPRNMASFART